MANSVKPLDLEDVIGIRSPSSLRWNPAGLLPSLAFLWDDDGTDLYVVQPEKEARPERLSDGTSEVTAFDWAPDGRSLAYIQRGELNRIDFDGGKRAADRLLIAGASVSDPRHSPDGRYLAFIIDERLAVFDRMLGGFRYLKVPQRMMTGHKASGPPVGGWFGPSIDWAPDSQRMAILFRDDGKSQVGVIDLSGTLLWRTYGRGRRKFVSWLGNQRVTFAETAESFKRRVWYLHDLSLGNTREILAEVDENHLSLPIPAIPSPDGSRLLFVIRQSGSDREHLYVCDCSDGDSATLRQITDGECEDTGHKGERPAWSPDGNRICFSSNRLTSTGERDLWLINADGSGLARLTELAGNSVEPQWSPDGRRIAFFRSGPFTSRDIWVADVRDRVGSGGPPEQRVSSSRHDHPHDNPRAQKGVPAMDAAIRQVTQSMPDAWTPEVQAESEYITYKSGDGWDIPAYLYRPSTARDRSRKKHPAVIWAHGGPQRSQMRYGWQPTFGGVIDAVNQWLVQRGYVVLAPNYRGTPGYGKRFEQANHMNMGVTEVADVIDGARFLKQQHYVDPERVGIWGASGGGYLTFGAMAKYPGEFRVGIELVGIWDQTQWIEWSNEDFDPINWNRAKLGGAPHLAPDVWFNASPRNFVAQITAPVIGFHGTADASVDFGQLSAFVRDMVEHGKEFEAHYYPDELHSFTRKAWRDIVPKIIRGFDRYLKPSMEPKNQEVSARRTSSRTT